MKTDVCYVDAINDDASLGSFYQAEKAQHQG